MNINKVPLIGLTILLAFTSCKMERSSSSRSLEMKALLATLAVLYDDGERSPQVFAAHAAQYAERNFDNREKLLLEDLVVVRVFFDRTSAEKDAALLITITSKDRGYALNSSGNRIEIDPLTQPGMEKGTKLNDLIRRDKR